MVSKSLKKWKKIIFYRKKIIFSRFLTIGKDKTFLDPTVD
jgi:hypothetical protein